jgi:perosamine synthetase
MNVPQFIPYIDYAEYDAIKECFDDLWITEGPKSKQFAKELCDIIGSKYGVFAPNGTLSLYLGLRALGIGPGDEVIVPDFTFIASANAIEMTGATPIFVDVGFDCQINIRGRDDLITPKTKAIMPVHMYGMSADMDQVTEFAKQHGLLIIEDAAQAFGVKWRSKGCGNWGHVGSFSFFADKTITTGEGGFVTTDDDDIYAQLQYLRNQGRLHRGTFEHPYIGYNFRITDIHAAVGLAQLRKFPTIASNKQKTYDRYRLKLNKNIAIVAPQSQHSTYIPFRVTVMTPMKAPEVIKQFTTYGIEGRSFFYPLHRQKCYQYIANDARHQDTEFPVSNKLYEHGVCLPSFASISDEQIDYVCDGLNRIIENGNS